MVKAIDKWLKHLTTALQVVLQIVAHWGNVIVSLGYTNYALN